MCGRPLFAGTVPIRGRSEASASLTETLRDETLRLAGMPRQSDCGAASRGTGSLFQRRLLASGRSSGVAIRHNGVNLAENPLEFLGTAGRAHQLNFGLGTSHQEFAQVPALLANEFINRHVEPRTSLWKIRLKIFYPLRPSFSKSLCLSGPREAPDSSCGSAHPS